MKATIEQLKQRAEIAEDNAALYLVQYHDTLKPIQNILEANGILTGMLSDILLHQSTKGVSEKSKAGRDRILKLMEIVYSFSSLDDHNTSLKLSLTAQMNRNAELEGKIEVLEKELEGVRKAWNQ